MLQSIAQQTQQQQSSRIVQQTQQQFQQDQQTQQGINPKSGLELVGQIGRQEHPSKMRQVDLFENTPAQAKAQTNQTIQCAHEKS
jgi:hypothetical protein